MKKVETIFFRADAETLRALERVRRALRRENNSDLMRFLINSADEKIRAEMTRAVTEFPPTLSGGNGSPASQES